MKKKTIADLLRECMKQYPGSMVALEKETGLHRASLLRFYRGERILRLDKAQVLVDFFGIECQKPKGK